MNHSGDTNKMVETPRTDDRVVSIDGNPWVNAPFARGLERELNAANERIKCLIEERDRANRLADWKWNLRGEFESLLGTDNIEEGIEAVKELKRRIQRLEEFARNIENDFDHDEDAHRYGTMCRVCDAAELLRETKEKEAKP